MSSTEQIHECGNNEILNVFNEQLLNIHPIDCNTLPTNSEPKDNHALHIRISDSFAARSEVEQRQQKHVTTDTVSSKFVIDDTEATSSLQTNVQDPPFANFSIKNYSEISKHYRELKTQNIYKSMVERNVNLSLSEGNSFSIRSISKLNNKLQAFVKDKNATQEEVDISRLGDYRYLPLLCRCYKIDIYFNDINSKCFVLKKNENTREVQLDNFEQLAHDILFNIKSVKLQVIANTTSLNNEISNLKLEKLYVVQAENTECVTTKDEKLKNFKTSNKSKIKTSSSNVIIGASDKEIPTNNVGLKMFEKLGWDGSPLGINNSGISAPLTAELKKDRKGL